MEREPLHIVTLMLSACVLLCIARANSEELDKTVAREIDNYDQNPDFISIDCGSNINYKDSDTGIWYQKDEGFVETGNNHVISSTVSFDYPNYGRQLNTLRYFPDGERNCYMLKPKQGKNNRYLIRAFFTYANYDGKNQTPSVFDLYLGVNLWDVVNISDADYCTYREIIHTPSTDTINVCLVKTGTTIPFISSLELRLLNTSSYQIRQIMSTTDPQPLLNLEIRIDVGTPGYSLDKFTRYKDDVYDRIWTYDPNYDENGWQPLNGSIDFGPGTTDAYKLPAQLWSSAARSSNVSQPLEFDHDTLYKALDRPYEYYVYFHFAEIEQLPAGQKRIISISLNSKPFLSQPLVLEYMKPITVATKTQGDIRFHISATSQSDAPPILNAFEIYKVITEVHLPTDERDVGAIQDIKRTYLISRLTWQGDPCLPQKYAWERLHCSPDSDTNPRITSLNLSSSNLTGEINISFSYLAELEYLDLSHNQLEGHLPEFLAQLPKLKVLNLTGNKLSGPIPKALKQKADRTLKLSLADNPDLCMTGSCTKKTFAVPLVASLSALFAILLISLGLWMFRRQKVIRSDTKKKGSMKSKSQAFSYAEILNITDNFKTIIGEGGFGKVYVGNLHGDTQVAVKILSPSSKQGYKEFQSEAQLLMIVHHRNLVSLMGYCDEGEIKALIYEYMANGNLQQHLSGENPNILNWNERLKIAIDAAHGLDYLHNGCKPPIIHRDLKTSNILLDENMHAKIADFGLSRVFGNDTDSYVSTRPAGTPAYVDPEFLRTGNSNKKCDIYSFGIILFELITGKQAVIRTTKENIHILQWVNPIIERGDIKSVVDPRLQENFNINSAWKAVEIALSCISPNVAERPDMSQILAELKDCLSGTQTNFERESFMVEFSSLQIESDIVPMAR